MPQGVAALQGDAQPAAQPAVRPPAGGDKVEKVAQVVVSVEGGLSQALSSKALVPFPQASTALECCSGIPLGFLLVPFSCTLLPGEGSLPHALPNFKANFQLVPDAFCQPTEALKE